MPVSGQDVWAAATDNPLVGGYRQAGGGAQHRRVGEGQVGVAVRRGIALAGVPGQPAWLPLLMIGGPGGARQSAEDTGAVGRG